MLLKQEETAADVKTLQGSTIKENISSLYGSSVARYVIFSSNEYWIS